MMYRLTVYSGPELALDHSQPDAAKVIRFAIQSLVELINQNAMDFRVEVRDKLNNCYFFALGPETLKTEIKRGGKPIDPTTVSSPPSSTGTTDSR